MLQRFSMDAKRRLFPLLLAVAAAVVPPWMVPAEAARAKPKPAVAHRVPTQPLDRMRITSSFGSRMHPILHRVENHAGVDLGASLNDPIRSVYDGVVTRAGWRGGYGNAVEIYHPKLHESTLYGHMNAVKVKSGQQVAEGQIIGLAGTTGLSTGVHLHFGVKKDGAWRDPIAFLDGLSDKPASIMIATKPTAPRSYKPSAAAKSATIKIAVKPKVDTKALQNKYVIAAKAAETWSQLYDQGAVSRNDRDAKIAAAETLEAQLKAAKAG